MLYSPRSMDTQMDTCFRGALAPVPMVLVADIGRHVPTIRYVRVLLDSSAMRQDYK